MQPPKHFDAYYIFYLSLFMSIDMWVLFLQIRVSVFLHKIKI